jgi:hypothetical protein
MTTAEEKESGGEESWPKPEERRITCSRNKNVASSVWQMRSTRTSPKQVKLSALMKPLRC